MAHLTLDKVSAISLACLLAGGCDQANAEAIAATVTAAERDRCPTHGLFRIPGYVSSIKHGKVNGAASPSFRDLAPTIVEVDAEGGFAPLAHLRSQGLLMERAREFGSAVLTMVDTYAFGTLWFEVEPLARNGFVVLACTNSRAYVAHPPGMRRVYGTNPMAFGWPRGDQPPLVFDQASSAMARGEIMLAAEARRFLPDHVAIDENGLPTTNPEKALAGTQLPFGGYKGASVALMVELLSCALTGEAFSYIAAETDFEDGGPQRGGVFMMAIDQERFRDQGTMHERAEALFAVIRGPGTARLPSERRYAARQETGKAGITISDSLHQELISLSTG